MVDAFRKLSAEKVMTYFAADTLSRIDKASGEVCSIDSVREKVAEWQEDGAMVIMSAGVFDSLHVNHLLALHHFRYLGAIAALERAGRRITDNSIRAAAASKMVKLVISSDTDARVSATKGRVAEKGGSPKPLLSWQTRSMMLAKQYIFSPDTKTAEPLVDMITRHGTDTCSGQRCPHDDNVLIAEYIRPDIILAPEASSKTIDDIQNSRLPKRSLQIFDENDLAFFDPLLSANVSTSAIIKRARS